MNDNETVRDLKEKLYRAKLDRWAQILKLDLHCKHEDTIDIGDSDNPIEACLNCGRRLNETDEQFIWRVYSHKIIGSEPF